MAFNARDEYTATASQTDFDITFPFLDSTYVKVLQNGAEITAFSVIAGSPNIARLDTGAVVDDAIVVYRDTAKTPLVAFTGGAGVTEENMDTFFDQLTHIMEEAEDEKQVAALAVSASTLVRINFSPFTIPVEGSGLLLNDSTTVPILVTKENINNTSPELLDQPGSDVMKPSAGKWKVTVIGQVRRDDTGTGRISVDWDLVNITDGQREDLSQYFIEMGEGLTTHPDDQQNLQIVGSAFLDLSAATSFKVRIAKNTGTDAAKLVNCSILWERLGA